MKLHPTTPYQHPLSEFREVTPQEAKDSNISPEDVEGGLLNNWLFASMVINVLRDDPSNQKPEAIAADLVQKVSPLTDTTKLIARVRQHEVAAMKELCTLMAHGLDKTVEKAIEKFR